MARPKEFDRDTALKDAIKVFSDHGFEGASTPALLDAMGISRQSMYDTFGDKRQLYLEALQRYNADSISAMIGKMNAGASPLKGLEGALVAFASRLPPEAALGCLGISAVCEFGRSDREIALLGDASGRILNAAFERLLGDAKGAGEIDPELDIQAAAQFLAATLSGMKVAARGGATPETLRGIAHMALRSLK